MGSVYLPSPASGVKKRPCQRIGARPIDGVAGLGAAVDHSPDGTVLFDFDSLVGYFFVGPIGR